MIPLSLGILAAAWLGGPQIVAMTAEVSVTISLAAFVFSALLAPPALDRRK